MTCPWSLILPVTEPGFKLGFVWIQSCACLMAKTQDQNGWWWRVNKRKGQLTPWGLCLKCSLIGQRLSVGSWALGLNAKAYERKPSSRYIKFLSLHYFFNRFSLLPVKSPASRCMRFQQRNCWVFHLFHHLTPYQAQTLEQHFPECAPSGSQETFNTMDKSIKKTGFLQEFSEPLMFTLSLEESRYNIFQFPNIFDHTFFLKVHHTGLVFQGSLLLFYIFSQIQIFSCLLCFLTGAPSPHTRTSETGS